MKVGEIYNLKKNIERKNNIPEYLRIDEIEIILNDNKNTISYSTRPNRYICSISWDGENWTKWNEFYEKYSLLEKYELFQIRDTNRLSRVLDE